MTFKELNSKIGVLYLAALIALYLLITLFGHPDNGEKFKNMFASPYPLIVFEKKFTGIVKKKYDYRGGRIVVEASKKLFEISPTSTILYDSAQIGDTIVKEKNSDRCSILNGRKIDCNCFDK